MEGCKNFEKNKQHCNCSYAGCDKKYTCCECLHYHRRLGELPACLFSDADERTYDRTNAKFIKAQGK